MLTSILSEGLQQTDHHPRCFTMWMAGAGVKDPVHVHDFQATFLYLMGIDHERLTYKFQARRFRLTDVEGKVVKDLLA